MKFKLKYDTISIKLKLHFNEYEPKQHHSETEVFDKQVHLQEWKNSMAGKNEERVMNVLENIGYKIDTDYKRQFPIGCKYVLDFAFPNEQIAIEIDGINHTRKEQKKSDKIRDRFLYEWSWVVIRIKDKELFGYKFSFYKYLIMYVVKERREQYETGRFSKVELPEFNDYDYE